jgi:membrane fusion protein, multidrug efflux system
LEPHLTRVKSAVLVIALAMLAACGKSSAHKEKAGDDNAPEVTVAQVQKKVIQQDLLVSGNLAALPNRDAKLAALVPGRIKAVLVNEGQRVTPEQAVAELDPSSYSEQLRQADAGVVQARANLENAKLSAARNEDLLRRGIAARKEVEDARTQLAVNQAALQQAEAGAATARTQLARTTIRAPFEGTAVHRFLGVGEQVDGTGGQPIIEVANIDTLELLGTVPASRLNEIRTNENFTFKTESVADAEFTGHVVAVLPAVDPATNNGTVRIRIKNQKHLLKLGMFVTVALPLKPGQPKLVVPRQSIYPDESGEPHVYKMTGNDAESVAVELGVQTKDMTEIVSGVNQGDQVIVSGGYGLPEKTKVRVKQ